MQKLILHSPRRCLEEVSGRITMLLLWARTREKEAFTALRDLVPTCRGTTTSSSRDDSSYDAGL